MKSYQLLCTFSNTASYKTDIKNIADLYPSKIMKFFVFENIKTKKDIYITYNIEVNKVFSKYPSTISIHRKKETNTLYTLNALNKLVSEENNGVIDKNFIINWELYRNCLILTNDISVRIIDIKLLEIL